MNQRRAHSPRPLGLLICTACHSYGGVRYDTQADTRQDSQADSVAPDSASPVPPGDQRADALVLVNSDSAHYARYEQLLLPYLENFGLPCDTLDLASTGITAAVADYALLVVGHRGLDSGGELLDDAAQEILLQAVQSGTGLVSFDDDLADEDGQSRYAFTDELFGFSYGGESAGTDVSFGQGTTLDCWDDEHQEPVLETTTDASQLDASDGQWTEFHYTAGGRPFPAVFAGVEEESYGLPVMHFSISGLEPGEYEVFANLYTGAGLRYHYGFSADDPKSHSVEVTAGDGGTDQHVEQSLGLLQLDEGSLSLYVLDADLVSGSYPYFGWAWLRLVPTTGDDQSHYVTAGHEADEQIETGEMSLAAIDDAGLATVLATCDSAPFLAVVQSGAGRAVQWASTDWMSHGVKGPVYGLDDLVWRSLVWAARKPFAMQLMPPLVTMRVDDVSGPFSWIDIANSYGLLPWAGLFLSDIDQDEASHLRDLVESGLATASVHAYTSSDFFYFDHSAGDDRSDADMEAAFAQATAWHEAQQIPISAYVLPHYYELGTNVFEGLADWDVEFVGTQMDPGNPYYGSAWVMGGPYRSYEAGTASESRPLYYAHYLEVPGHPEHDGRFFNVVTEIRDDAGYEWYPDGDVEGSVGRGLRQTQRALDSRVLATLFSHEQYVGVIADDDWDDILAGVTAGLESYGPIYVTQDQGARYARALHSSAIVSSSYDPESGLFQAALEGETDLQTWISVFVGDDDIEELRLELPSFSGEAELSESLQGD